MRRDFVKECVQHAISNPPKTDTIQQFDYDLTPEEWDYFDQLIKEESDKLTEWPEIGVIK